MGTRMSDVFVTRFPFVLDNPDLPVYTGYGPNDWEDDFQRANASTWGAATPVGGKSYLDFAPSGHTVVRDIVDGAGRSRSSGAAPAHTVVASGAVAGRLIVEFGALSATRRESVAWCIAGAGTYLAILGRDGAGASFWRPVTMVNAAPTTLPGTVHAIPSAANDVVWLDTAANGDVTIRINGVLLWTGNTGTIRAMDDRRGIGGTSSADAAIRKWAFQAS